MLIPIRKAQAGSDSLGHVWEEDGAVVRVSPPHAEVLLAIKDAGFSVADDSWLEPQPGPGSAADGEGGGTTAVEFAEVDPKAEAGPEDPGSEGGEGESDEGDAPGAPAKAARKTAARKTAASKPE